MSSSSRWTPCSEGELEGGSGRFEFGDEVLSAWNVWGDLVAEARLRMPQSYDVQAFEARMADVRQVQTQRVIARAAGGTVEVSPSLHPALAGSYQVRALGAAARGGGFALGSRWRLEGPVPCD